MKDLFSGLPHMQLYQQCSASQVPSAQWPGSYESLFQWQRVRKTNSFCSMWQALPCSPSWGFYPDSCLWQTTATLTCLLAQVFVPGTGDTVPGTSLPLLLPLYCQQFVNKPSQKQSPERRSSLLSSTLWQHYFVCSLDDVWKKAPLLSTGAQWPSQREEEWGVPSPTPPRRHPSSLQDLAFQPCMCPASIIHIIQQRCHLLVLHLCNAAFHLS